MPKPPRGSGVRRNIAKQEFARRLRAALDEKGWNYSDLAREAAKQTRDKAFQRNNVSLYAGGKSLPRRDHLVAMARALGKRPDDLLPPALTEDKETAAEVVRMVDIGNGRCVLTVSKEVTAATALRVWTILQEDDNAKH